MRSSGCAHTRLLVVHKSTPDQTERADLDRHLPSSFCAPSEGEEHPADQDLARNDDDDDDDDEKSIDRSERPATVGWLASDCKMIHEVEKRKKKIVPAQKTTPR